MTREFKCHRMSRNYIIITVFYYVFQHVKKEMTRECKCHGMSGSCIIIIVFLLLLTCQERYDT